MHSQSPSESAQCIPQVRFITLTKQPLFPPPPPHAIATRSNVRYGGFTLSVDRFPGVQGGGGGGGRIRYCRAIPKRKWQRLAAGGALIGSLCSLSSPPCCSFERPPTHDAAAYHRAKFTGRRAAAIACRIAGGAASDHCRTMSAASVDRLDRLSNGSFDHAPLKVLNNDQRKRHGHGQHLLPSRRARAIVSDNPVDTSSAAHRRANRYRHCDGAIKHPDSSVRVLPRAVAKTGSPWTSDCFRSTRHAMIHARNRSPYRASKPAADVRQRPAPGRIRRRIVQQAQLIVRRSRIRRRADVNAPVAKAQYRPSFAVASPGANCAGGQYAGAASVADSNLLRLCPNIRSGF